MPKKIPVPHQGTYYGMTITNTEFPDGTWLEGEEFAYPAGGFTRRAWVNMPDLSRRVVRCSIPDTMFSIPARFKDGGFTTRGFLTTNENGIKFTEEIAS
jgi:hypothetical protein